MIYSFMHKGYCKIQVIKQKQIVLIYFSDGPQIANALFMYIFVMFYAKLHIGSSGFFKK